MNNTFTIKDKNGYVYGYGYVHLLFTQASTFQANYMVLDARAVVTEVNSIIQDEPMKHLRPDSLPEIDDFTDDEELEWDTLFAQPHVQAGLDRLAKEAERQFIAGETEEGGFAVE